jgi:hypothetical protein
MIMGEIDHLFRAPDCGSGCHGFESRYSPQKQKRDPVVGISFFCIELVIPRGFEPLLPA